MIKRYIYILLIILTLPLSATADIIVLQSGQKIDGIILTRNDDIVVIETVQGRRFQYPASEIKEIIAQTTTSTTERRDSIKTSSGMRKVALRLMIDGGAAFLPNEYTGGTVGTEIGIGTHNLAGRRVFLGGSVGYFGCYMSGITHFIPFQAVISVPVTGKNNSPEIGVSFGYSVGVKNKKNSFTGDNAGGLTGSVTVGYRWQRNKNTALFLGLKSRFQQSSIISKQTIEGNDYSLEKGVCYITTCALLQVQF